MFDNILSSYPGWSHFICQVCHESGIVSKNRREIGDPKKLVKFSQILSERS